MSSAVVRVLKQRAGLTPAPDPHHQRASNERSAGSQRRVSARIVSPVADHCLGFSSASSTKAARLSRYRAPGGNHYEYQRRREGNDVTRNQESSPRKKLCGEAGGLVKFRLPAQP
jgi:hypothetical protein